MKFRRQISLFCSLCLFLTSFAYARPLFGHRRHSKKETTENKTVSTPLTSVTPVNKNAEEKSAEPVKVDKSETDTDTSRIFNALEAEEKKKDQTTVQQTNSVKSSDNSKIESASTASSTPAMEYEKKYAEHMTAEELKQQDISIRREVMEFVKKNGERQPGEGWIFLARHYFELKQHDRALAYLNTLIRSEEINPRMVWEAKLLRDEIYKDLKQYDIALKNIDELIKAKPARIYLVRAKIARAELLSRDLTNVKDLLNAFQRYYWHYPEVKGVEEIQYLMGFERGYDLEIAMKAMEAWEEISKFPEIEASNLANLHLAMLYAFDLNNAERAIPFVDNIRSDKSHDSEVKLIRAVIGHFYTKEPNYDETDRLYREYCLAVNDLQGFRVGTILHGQMLSEKAKKHEEAINIWENLLTVPVRLVASESISIDKRREEYDEQLDWSILACRMAGHTSEFKVKNLDRARAYYLRIDEMGKARSHEKKDPVNAAALKRTEPSKSAGEALFEMAYEKYRHQNFKEAIKLYTEFIEKYPESELYKEAIFRIAVIRDDDLRQYEAARVMYENYIIQFKPLESKWKLDKIFNWGRVDEARYRIGNLLALHLNSQVEALDVFKELVEIYPDSYWAKQGLRDSIRIYKEDVADLNKANELMKEFIRLYPDSDDAADYRITLYKIALGKGDNVEALYLIRDYLDHRLPSEKNYFTYKQQWRDLVFRIREANLRERLNAVGDLDKISVYQSLVDVVALASTTAPLKDLITEIKGLEIKDEYRWSLAYEAGTRLYTESPDAAYDLFKELAETATGTPKIACLLTLGNIAYRVKKKEDEAVKYYEAVSELLPLTDTRTEIPCYRLGRLYLKQGHGLKGMEKLYHFVTRFPHSKYTAKAYMVMGDACVALYSPEKASRYYNRVLRIAPNMADEVHKKIASLEGKMTSEQWLRQRAGKANEEALEQALSEEEAAAEYDKSMTDAADQIKDASELEEEDLEKIDSEILYGLFLKENKSKNPDADRMAMYLTEILCRSDIPSGIRDRACRQLISTRFFRYKDHESFIEAAKKILLKHNYADWQSELLYKLAQAQDYQANDYEEALKSYFEYTSFYPDKDRFMDVRSRIPEVYELAEDTKNAIRFYSKLIDDQSVSDEYRLKASMSLAHLYLGEDKKTDAITTYELALALESDRRPEICLRLEKLTDDFSYVQRALDAQGNEEYRLKALKRLIKKCEEDGNFNKAKEIMAKYTPSFEDPESAIYLDKKVEELAKRGAITDMEELIDQYPEEEETPGRMFKLAKMVEGQENTKYRAEDLFYEITLVYPESQYFKESKIRADNVRAIKASEELTDMLKKGNKPGESEEILIERARLLKENMKDLAGAMENYESFLKLFPNSKRMDEVCMILGDLALSENQDPEKAYKYWEKGLQASIDPFNRESLTERINNLKNFNTSIIYSEDKAAQEKGIREIFRIWKMERNPLHALGLLKNAYSKLENTSKAAMLHYYAGRIYEESKNYRDAQKEYETAIENRYMGFRRDMLMYRLARMLAAEGKKEEAYKWYKRLVRVYPRSLLSRSGNYWLSKYYEENNKLTRAYEHLENVLTVFTSIHPLHRETLQVKLKDLGARMNIADMERLKKYSKTGGSELPYYIGKVLEYDLQDIDKAITQYEEFLKTNPPVRRGREIMDKIAGLYEKKGDYVKAVGYLDMLLSTYEPTAQNFDLILRIGTLLEHKVKNDQLTQLFFSSIEGEYYKVRKVRQYATAKLDRLVEKKREAAKPAKKKIIKREYSEEDEEILDELKDIIAKQVDDLQNFKQAERDMEDLWDENPESLATLDIMKALVDLNVNTLLDYDKAAKYYAKWIEENPHDPMYKENVLKLYDHYMDVMKDGQKALRLLQDYTKDHPISLDSLDIEFKLAKTNETLLRNYAEAQRGYQRIIDTQQNDEIVHEAYYRMGFVYRDGFANYTMAISTWQNLINQYYSNKFADQAQFAMAYTYEAYLHDYTQARAAYDTLIKSYPNSSLQNEARNGILRVEGK